MDEDLKLLLADEDNEDFNDDNSEEDDTDTDEDDEGGDW